MKTSARLFNCTLCHAQAVICSRCDRGNIYCGSGCSQYARAKNHRLANQTYQNTSKGRRVHAERQQRYRERQITKVTDQGSPSLPPHDLLSASPSKGSFPQRGLIICHFCDQMVSPFLRHGFLYRDKSEQSGDVSSWPLAP